MYDNVLLILYLGVLSCPGLGSINRSQGTILRIHCTSTTAVVCVCLCTYHMGVRNPKNTTIRLVARSVPKLQSVFMLDVYIRHDAPGNGSQQTAMALDGKDCSSAGCWHTCNANATCLKDAAVYAPRVL